jgi:FkbM family methyltransferase
VGANAGVFTIAASQWVGSQGLVVSFEPSSREYKLLEENIGLNHLANVRLEKTAISNESGLGMLQIAVDKHNGQNTLCQEFAYENVRSGVVESVDLVTLDKYVNDHGISRLDLIKIDVEGAELRAFQGAENTLKTLRPALIFEIVKSALKKNGIDSEEIESFLVQRNYKLFSIDEETAHLVPTRLSEMRDGNAVALPSENIAYPILGLTQD